MKVEDFNEDSSVGGDREDDGYSSSVQETPILLPILQAAAGYQDDLQSSSHSVQNAEEGSAGADVVNPSSPSVVPEASPPPPGRFTKYSYGDGGTPGAVPEDRFTKYSCGDSGTPVAVPEGMTWPRRKAREGTSMRRRRVATVVPPFPQQVGSGRLSVSFGDVTVCDRLDLQQRKPKRRQSLPPGWCSRPRPSVFDIPDIDDIILAGASPAMEQEQQKRPHRKSFIQCVTAVPEWLANKHIFGSVSSVSMHKTGMQDTKLNPCMDVATLGSTSDRQELTQMLEQVRKGYLTAGKAELRVAGKVRFRVLRPSVTMGAFGAWKDVENASLTVSSLAVLTV